MLQNLQIRKDEKVLWTGTKDKKVTVLESIFNPMMPIAAIWGLLDFSFISVLLRSGDPRSGSIILFFLVHLLPVWIYLGGVLTSSRAARNSFFCVTDKAVYIQKGIFETKTERFIYRKILAVGTNQSMVDRRAGTGDVCLTLDEIVYSGKHHTPHQRVVKIENIADFEDVFMQINEILIQNEAAQQQFGMPQQPMYGNAPEQQFGMPQQPMYGNAPEQRFGMPQQPMYGNAPEQRFGMPQQPMFGDPGLQSTQVTQQFGSPAPQPAAVTPEPEMPSVEMPSLTIHAPKMSAIPEDTFHDPTLDAFDFMKDDASGTQTGEHIGF